MCNELDAQRQAMQDYTGESVTNRITGLERINEVLDGCSDVVQLEVIHRDQHDSKVQKPAANECETKG